MAETPLILISAMGHDRIIGARDRMPWRVPEEFAQFLRFVEGNVVLMGRKSYEIFDKDLKAARVVVVSRSGANFPGVAVAMDVPTAVAIAKSHGAPVFCAGGAQVYAGTMPLADELWLSFIAESEIERSTPGDAFFPEIDDSVWFVAKTETHPRFEFRVYRRRPSV